ncbi:hypothetical protein SAMN05421870_10569 [Streptomyces qinglanensis]|uniref:Uncharacterized protein n=1 Tax=Streptomyces qinglanensis TaxID=943816 RepID=A0A1H9SSP7_9ACTN|nr:hypothetical protein SAMN05421870_10569 [Streptomyces qinglanensis]
MPFTSGIRAWPSGRFAAGIPTDMGRSDRSVIRSIFEPYVPRSTGFGSVRSPLSRPACSPSRSRTATSPARRGHRVRRGPGGGAWPTPWPSTTPQTAGAWSLRAGRTTTKATAATYSLTWQRTRSRPALPGRCADAAHRPAAATAPLAPLAGTAPTTRPAPAAQRSPLREASDRKARVTVSGPVGAARRTEAAPAPDAMLRPPLRAVHPLSTCLSLSIQRGQGPRREPRRLQRSLQPARRPSPGRKRSPLSLRPFPTATHAPCPCFKSHITVKPPGPPWPPMCTSGSIANREDFVRGCERMSSGRAGLGGSAGGRFSRPPS